MHRCISVDIKQLYKMVLALLIIATVGSCAVLNYENKRSVTGERILEDPSTQVNYDEYPVIVPKRAALLLDRMMVALQKAMQDDEEDAFFNSIQRDSPRSQGNSIDIGGLSRSNGQQKKGGNYLKCYFNAVTCFKRK